MYLYTCREGELGSESEDIARVLDEEGDDEGEYQDEQDEAPEWLFERPTVRQSLGDGAAIGRRLEERRRVQRLPSEGRNREEQPGEAAALVSGPADRGLIPRDGVWVNAYAKWREDAARNSLKAQLAFWPHWVYRQFDAYDLARRAAGEYNKILFLFEFYHCFCLSCYSSSLSGISSPSLYCFPFSGCSVTVSALDVSYTLQKSCIV